MMKMLYTEEIFQLDQFGQDKIKRQTVFKEMQFNPRQPSYLGFDLTYEEIEDETSLIQYG